MKKFLIGGSPCTHWSVAQSKNRETSAEGIGWELFKNYLIAKEKFKPDFFLYENNKSAAQAIKDRISYELGAPLQYINSALVSAQNRQRFYVHNFGNVPLPEDRGISFQDIMERDAEELKKYKVPRTPSREKMWNNGRGCTVRHSCKNITEAIKTNCLTTKQDRANNTGLVQFEDFCRYITVKEACRLQTMPDDYCRVATVGQAYKALGNGWTAEVIIHLLSYALAAVPKDEEIVVLSMYDGIGTGRYCFDRLGYHNIKYYAYEIDKYAMQIANSNYADIIQCGDAFRVREEGWEAADAVCGGQRRKTGKNIGGLYGRVNS